MQKTGIFIDTFPAIVGSDSAGIVEEVGEGVTAFKKGDRVLVRSSYLPFGEICADIRDASVHQGYFTIDTSTFQEYTTVPAEIVAKVLRLGVQLRYLLTLVFE